MSNKTKTIKWYSCGPTVYDVAHLGHARCYITFDIMRRILADYFGYQVFYVMNITDIDDKIIKRARSNYLCDKFIDEESSKMSRTDMVAYLREALSSYQTKRKHENDPAKVDMINKTIDSSLKSIKDIEELSASADQKVLESKLNQIRDIIADYQDDKLGHTVIDHGIFKNLTRKFEQEFHDDMRKLNVLPPSSLTRVSEFIDEIGLFVKKLESNGYAYPSGGSIYFDTIKFDADPKHSYAKLVREAFECKKPIDVNDGDGELSAASQDKKKAPSDFALWKKSKPGEPHWVTQGLEPGRPGWHIECSVMASIMLGENFDMHSGGCDLKFPHHDNEIAQSEAYYDTGRSWINYFVHSGHLKISGCKMSKSLKNFVTIRQALNEYTARQLRFAFLAHSWAETLDYSPNTMKTAVTYEKTFKEFFLTVADYSRQLLSNPTKAGGDSGSELCDIYRKWSKEDHELNDKFLHAVDKVDIALCDNINTRAALNALTALIKECNKRQNTDLILIRDITDYIMRILAIFGTSFDEIKFKPLYRSTDDEQVSEDTSEIIFKYVDALARFRADVRKISKAGLTGDPQQGFKQILTLCDTLRDKTLPSLGAKLEDKEVQGVPYVIKLMDPK